MQQKFLNRVLDEILKEDGNWENFIFVVPSRRAASFLKACIAQKTEHTIFAPEIYSIETFIEKLSGLTYATPTEQLFVLYHSYLELEGGNKESFLEFSKWARILLSDFDEIDRYLIPHHKIFSYLGAITEVNHWYLQKERTPLMHDYIEFWNQLEPLYSKFRSGLLENDKGHQGLLYRIATERTKQYLDDNPGKKHLFIGFNALNNSEAHIIQEILNTTEAEIFWDLDQYFLDETYHDAGLFIRQHLKRWDYYRNHLAKGINNDYLNPKTIEITGVPKNVTQVKYIGNLLKQTTSASAMQNTALILADETLLNPLLNALPDELNSANITMGYPLKNTPIAAFFTQFVTLYLREETTGWYYKNVLSFVSQPYVQLMLSEQEVETVENLKQDIYQKNKIYLTQTTLHTLGGEIWQVIFNKDNNKADHFLDSCLKLVGLIKNKLEVRDERSLEMEYLYGMYTLFNQLKAMVAHYTFINDIPTLNSLLTDLLQQESIDFQGEPLEGLQIMGMLESRVLDFETVIICSVNEGIIPSGKQGNSFIPFDVKKEMGLPTYKEKDAVYTYHFYRLLQRAKNVHIVYNTEPDVLVGGEPSRLISQLEADQNISPYIKHTLASMDIVASQVLPTVIVKDKTLLDAIAMRADKGFSPTSLTQYIRDPLEFYKRTILQIEESPDVEENIAAKTFGIIIHEVLEEIFTPFVGQYLEEEKLLAIKPDIEPIVKRYFTEFYDESSITRGKNSIAYQVLLRYIENYLDAEIHQLKFQRIKLIALEKQMKIEINVPGITFPVRIKGKIDRIDEVNGQLRILDYKTGKVSVSEMNVVDWDKLILEPDLNKVFQVLCYALLYTSEKEFTSLEAGVISFKNMKEGFIAFATKEKPTSRIRNTEISAEVMGLFNQQLNKLIHEICDPNVPFTERLN